MSSSCLHIHINANSSKLVLTLHSSFSRDTSDSIGRPDTPVEDSRHMLGTAIDLPVLGNRMSQARL